ncbi:polysaccharide deacetylase family protein [Cellulosilyticum lentocellum]|uniref:Polysaccharide deacetylase n=1 Tax=Cellulosilyticum lentocellum (strain ATCC 49066 / DSM 5427 / NCIMB 11756 / RHM5) TaxID=642492 RepID=F2JHJ4_CELLD|nr:polysaccharide deacetylase family protein [Cellulosilyticum lentocellum]ADZ84233.1 polysaccharide deacetylase [Cellulosilyticum lentocellum DSM 5427]
MKKRIKSIILLFLVLIQITALGSPVDQDKSKGQIEYKVLYLTFDDGPSEYTGKLLDVLAKYHMKATFFMLDAEMKRNPDMVKRIVAEGHAVGVHGVTHEKSTFYCGTLGPLKEMDKANATLEQITGSKTNLARTPYGSSPYLTKKQAEALAAREYVIWDWNIDSKDWCYRNPYKTFRATTQMIQKSQKEPKVILFHDIKHVVETMTLFLEWMQEHQYTSKPITTDITPVKLKQKIN